MSAHPESSLDATIATTYPEYSLDAAMAKLFSQTSATRAACDIEAKDLAGGQVVVPVTVQGNCSYSVYAGPGLEFVVQFRLKSLMLESETMTLAREIYGSLVPSVSFHGQLGDDHGKEPLFIYVMNRIQGISYLDFALANGSPENSDENFAWRKTFMSDVARYGPPSVFPYPPNLTTKMPLHFLKSKVLIGYSFFALSWKAPQEVDSDYRENLRRTYVEDLQQLLHCLPPRFHQVIQKCLSSMEAILSLPMVLLHRDFSSCNIMVDGTSCHLTGVIDWAEAEICPFGQNLDTLKDITGALHLKNGWRRYEGYEALQDTF